MVDDVREPVTVRDVSEESRSAADAFRRLRDELSGGRCGTHDEIDEFVKQIALRLSQMASREREALLMMLAVERLAGVRDKPAITIPKRLLMQRLASRS